MESDLAEWAAEQGKDDDAASKLTYEIFSILESKFLFGCGGIVPQQRPSVVSSSGPPVPRAPAAGNNKVCVLSIDGGARPADGLLAAAALVRLEAALRRRAGSKDARLADFFDVCAGSGAGGVLAALLFARGPRGRPLCSAEDALGFLLRRVHRHGSWSSSRAGGVLSLARHRGRSSTAFGRVFGDLTLRDTVRPVLVPCYDLGTRAPFLFSRADAAESPAHDFRLRDVCAATTCAAGEVASVDGATRLTAVGSGVALGNPTAAAITHVLNNRREFPGAASLDDLLVMSIATGGESTTGGRRRRSNKPAEVARIAAEGVSDMVDQAVAMAFGQSRTSNYVRIQGTGARLCGGGRGPRTACGGETKQQAVWRAEAVLLQKGVESVLFRGRRLAGETNAEKLERFARELAREHERRKQQPGGNPIRSPAGGAGFQLVPPPPPTAPAIKMQPKSKTPSVQNDVAPTTSSAPAIATTTTEAAAAVAQQGAPMPRRRRRTHVRTAVVAAAKRAPGTSSSSSHGAWK